ncbi:MAG: TIM barrel protein [Verrucomicrobiota bacterium]
MNLRKNRILTHGGLLAALLGLSLSGYAEQQKFEVGLSMYSIRELFKSGELHAHDYPEFAKKTFGITKIDVWDGGFPKDYKQDPDFLPELKRRADAAGAEIFLVMTGAVNGAAKDDKALKKNGLKFSRAVDQAEILGARYVRVFLSTDKKADDAERIRKASIALGALADYAKKKDITIAIEPSPNTPLGSFYAKLMQTMQHSHITLMPDFGKMLGTDIYQGTQDMLPYSKVVSAKTHDIAEDGSAEEFDYPRLMKIINESDFSGIIAIEYEGEKLGPVEGVIATKKLIEVE